MQSDLTDRQRVILSTLRRSGRVLVEDLAVEHGVTTQTVRRDLNELCDRGFAARVHGGARLAPAVTAVAYEDRRGLAGPEKRSIGQRAAAIVPNDCSVMINIGTTTEQVAQALSGHTGLVVISNNLNVVRALMGADAKELILAGGVVRPSDGAIVGEEAVEFISRYKVDYAVIGASALDEDGAVLDYDGREVAVARAILRNARRRILVCDATKFERTAPVRICDISDLDMFVTDAPPPAEFVRRAEGAATEIVIASPNAEASDAA